MQKSVQFSANGDSQKRQDCQQHTVEVIAEDPPRQVTTSQPQPSAFVKTDAAEDQQTATLAPRTALKQEEQDETSNRPRPAELVGVIDPDCPTRQIYVPATGPQQTVPSCKLSARRRYFQKRDPCMQRSALFKESLLDAPADERKRT
mmetsp:Transcript_44137/g.58569  ORF Transcript_44137/g.58569 Transcript_44137/m.58569 type:complete len:147 (+) Transcript_44137:649-1089(+)